MKKLLIIKTILLGLVLSILCITSKAQTVTIESDNIGYYNVGKNYSHFQNEINGHIKIIKSDKLVSIKLDWNKNTFSDIFLITDESEDNVANYFIGKATESGKIIIAINKKTSDMQIYISDFMLYIKYKDIY